MNKSLSELTTDFEVYEYIKNHLLLQGAKSEIDTSWATGSQIDNACAYRSDDDKKCAVGCIISDKFYTHSLEGKACNHEDVLDVIELSVPNWIVNRSMLKEMQMIHDEKEPDEWYLMLEDMIRSFPDRNKFVEYSEEAEI
jgi:hypothetical protein